MNIKLILAMLFLISFATHSLAQKTVEAGELTDAQWSSLFSALEKENWKEAYELSSKYVEQLKNDDTAKAIANLRYMLIYSAAGAVSVRKLSYDDLEKQLAKVVGKKIATPFHPLGVECRPPMFNYLCKSGDDSKYDVFTTATNKAATSILAFEYTKLTKAFDFAKHKEEFAAVIGTVDKIVPNPNKSTLIILRIFIKDAEIVLQSDIKSNISTSANKCSQKTCRNDLPPSGKANTLKGVYSKVGIA